jgi:putative photosynthetic complex assembly protein 2
MNDRTLAALFVLAVWWLSTGVVLKMVWLGRSGARLSVVALTATALSALWATYWSSKSESIGAAYLAFGCAVAIWGWHELTFLLGIITGPRKVGCPAEARGWRRFAIATSAVIHHELALAATLLALVALTWRQPNQVATWTFAVLWVMRLSAKVNVFLGVRNLTEQFVPEHLRYMLSYFRRARMNPFMPVSLLLAGAAAIQLWALPPDATPFVVVGRTLVATLLALAVIEHVFLAVPLPDALLWRWAIRRKRDGRPETLPDLPAEVR